MIINLYDFISGAMLLFLLIKKLGLQNQLTLVLQPQSH